MRITFVASATLATLLLSGCSTLPTLPYFKNAQATTTNTTVAHSATTSAANGQRGVAITQTRPEMLESITFFTNTLFSAKAADTCVQAYLSAPAEDNPIKYLGRDALTTSGSTSGEDRTLGILYGGHQIDFNLALLGQHNGTHYGFSQLRLAKQDKLKISNHDLRPILANSGDSKRVYQTLETLFKKLDACVVESK
ncbi:hypothetical protein [Oceanisphaera sp. W20_SRM_FM3]|uniref:hypothetical protein n=1 Tax=Oceanisphaera sp. W20_SRM_FM3 TaxID=3240267 RepID=UPI003F99F460